MWLQHTYSVQYSTEGAANIILLINYLKETECAWDPSQVSYVGDDAKEIFVFSF